VEVRVHELGGEVHVVERLRDWWRDDVPDAYDLVQPGSQILELIASLERSRQSRSRNALTFSWSRCLRSLISRSVRLASMWLSKALAIFLMATISPVSSFITELHAAAQNFQCKNHVPRALRVNENRGKAETSRGRRASSIKANGTEQRTRRSRMRRGRWA
jgi:hypothetical protein